MRPHVGDTSPAAFVNAIRREGMAKFAQFGQLSAASRTCAVRPCPASNDLISERSDAISPGPTSVFRRRLPRWFTGGSSNAAMSQYGPGPPRIGLLEYPGL